jgi:hypothetical protein
LLDATCISPLQGRHIYSLVTHILLQGGFAIGISPILIFEISYAGSVQGSGQSLINNATWQPHVHGDPRTKRASARRIQQRCLRIIEQDNHPFSYIGSDLFRV